MTVCRWAIEGAVSHELLSYQGAVLVHDNPREVEWLFPRMFEGGARMVKLPRQGIQRPLMRLRDHPSMGAVSFPLRREDFRSFDEMRKGEGQ